MIVEPLKNLITEFIKLAFGFGLLLLVFVLIYLGILYITGNRESISKVHSRWNLIIIGILLLFLPFLIIRLIGLFFDINIF